MEEKLPDYVIKQCTIYYLGHVIIIRLIRCGNKPFYTAYYSVDKKFKGKDTEWLNDNFPFVHCGYYLPPSTLVGCDPKLTFVGWNYNHNGDITEDYSFDLIKEEAILALEQYINMFEEGER